MSNNGSAALAADGFFLAWAETLSMDKKMQGPR